MIAITCGLLGFAIEVGSLFYSLVVAFLVSTVACLWFAWRLREMAIDKEQYELIIVAAGVVLLIPAWVLHPDHIAFLRSETLVAYSEFLAVMSHEIRTPLQSVLGYSNLLKNTRLDEKQMSCLDTIQSEGKILLRIVQDILDFSNLRKASPELKEGPVRLKSLIEETYRTIQPMAERKGLVAELEVDPSLPAIIRADGVRLRQALLNLYGNSVKYTERGSVKLSVGPNGIGRGPGALAF